MNAMTPFVLSRDAITDLDDIEGKLDRIIRLATAASVVVEHGLGRAAPAAELEVLLAFISETAAEAEALRARGMKALGPK